MIDGAHEFVKDESINDEVIDLSQFDEEYSNTKVEERHFEEIPDGTYQVVVVDAKVRLSKAGHPMLSMQLKILGTRYKNQRLFRNNMMTTPENIKWLKTDLYTAGLKLEKLSDLPERAKDLIGTTLEVQKKTRGDNYNVYINRTIEIDLAQDIMDPFENEGAMVF